MIITCPGCRRDVELPQDFLVHAAFTQRGYLYCEACPNTLTIESADPALAELVGPKHPWTLTYREKKLVEARLRPCPCGSKFQFDNPPRCPACKASWAPLVPDRLQYYETGRVIRAQADGWWAS
jgi:uncharacterized protein YbaR (Trm112 family)